MNKKEKSKQLSNLKQYIYKHQSKILDCNVGKFKKACKQHIDEFEKIDDEDMLRLICEHLRYIVQSYQKIPLGYVPALFFIDDDVKGKSKYLYDLDSDYQNMNIPF